MTYKLDKLLCIIPKWRTILSIFIELSVFHVIDPSTLDNCTTFLLKQKPRLAKQSGKNIQDCGLVRVVSAMGGDSADLQIALRTFCEA